ncbi:MAG: NOG1 family protein [Nanobdellota archaeon]
MNFQDLAKIETPDSYLDMAFNAARKRAEIAKQQKCTSKLQKSRHVESIRVQTIGGNIQKRMDKILTAFPSIGSLPPFYEEMIKVTLDYQRLRKSLGAINWAKNMSQKLTSQYEGKINRCQHLKNIGDYRKEYYGRLSSVIKQIKNELAYLDEARKVMRRYPAIKTDIFTVSICGFPNIGKTTLLSKITDARPEINNYSFTTKGINVGYIFEDQKRVVQVIDTPGTLNRFNKMNDIEKQAYIAMKYTASTLVYIFDLTESYPIKDQKKLFLRLKEENKDIIIYLSKADLLDNKKIEEFTKNLTNVFTDPDALRKHITVSAKNI